MYKFIVLLLLVLLQPPKQKTYIIVVGDVTCKACVIEIHNYLYKNNPKNNSVIAFRDKGNFILNESSSNYFKTELPKANFIFLRLESFFPQQEKYPYLLSILENDTLKIPYDSLYKGGDLNLKFLK